MVGGSSSTPAFGGVDALALRGALPHRVTCRRWSPHPFAVRPPGWPCGARELDQVSGAARRIALAAVRSTDPPVAVVEVQKFVVCRPAGADRSTSHQELHHERVEDHAVHEAGWDACLWAACKGACQELRWQTWPIIVRRNYSTRPCSGPSGSANCRRKCGLGAGCLKLCAMFPVSLREALAYG